MAFPTGWNRKARLQVGPPSSTLSNVRVCLTQANLPSEMLGTTGTAALNGGGDIRFSTDSEGLNQIACEVVSFVTNANPALGTAEIWVLMPSLPSGSSSQLWVWWNNAGQVQPAAGAAFGSQAVWASDFGGVWHMGQDPSGSAPQISDSTSNGLNGTANGSMTSGQSVAGKAGNGLSFDATNDYVAVGTSTAIAPTDQFTISFSFKAAGSANQVVLSRTRIASLSWALWVYSTQLRLFWSDSASAYEYQLDFATSLDVGNWHHWTVAYDKTAYVSKAPAGIYKETHGGSVVYNNKIYCIGGYGGTTGVYGRNYSGSQLLNATKYYDPATDTWTVKSSTGYTQRTGSATFVLNGKIYAMGGVLVASSAPTQVCQVYDIATDTWSNLSNGPTGLQACGANVACVVNVGGTDRAFVLLNNTMYEYTPGGDTWTALTSRSFGTDINTWSACCTDGTYVYTFGGFSTAQSVVSRYHPATDTWVTNHSTAPYTAWAGVAVYDSTSGNVYYGLGRKTTGGTLEQESRWYKWDRTAGTGGWTQLTTDSAPGNAFYYGVVNRVLYVSGVRFYDNDENQDDGQYHAAFDIATETHLTQAAHVKVYKDGVRVRRIGYGKAFLQGATVAEFGSYDGYHAGNWLNGTLDEVRISKVAASADRVAADYQTLYNPSTFVTRFQMKPGLAARATQTLIGGANA